MDELEREGELLYGLCQYINSRELVLDVSALGRVRDSLDNIRYMVQDLTSCHVRVRVGVVRMDNIASLELNL